MYYYRVGLKAGKRTKYVTLECESPYDPAAHWLVGFALDREGDRQDLLHLIDRAAITKVTELVMDLHYGELVPANRVSAAGRRLMQEGSLG